MSAQSANQLLATPLNALHRGLGARMIAFAGYDMPLRYAAGILDEHRHTRDSCGLFDISHMGQAIIRGSNAARALEALVPSDIQEMGAGSQRYTLLTNDDGGIRDNLMVSNMGDHLFLVVNAARKADDFAHLAAALPSDCRLEVLEDRALLALQGPRSAEVLARFCPAVRHMPFMNCEIMRTLDVQCRVSRSGFTGEDGFELSVPAGMADELARQLLNEPEVRPAGLGARDTLRLEAGLCLYGNDLDATVTPIEAGLAWTIPERRREDGGFPGAATIRRQLAEGPARRRVGLRIEGRAPARAGAAILRPGGTRAGTVTSGGFGPSVGHPLAMGYVAADLAAPGTRLTVDLRGRPMKAWVTELPFVPARYFRS